MFAPEDFKKGEVVFASEKVLVVRGRLQEKPCFAKIFLAANGDITEFARFQNELSICLGGKLACAATAYGETRVEGVPAILFEEEGGVFLPIYRRTIKADAGQLVRLAVKMVEPLAELHAAGFTHRKITPQSFLYFLKEGKIKLFDLDAATFLAREYPEFAMAKDLGAGLEYLAPEQTGRMNRPVDYRCDFYSLGCVLFEMLTGVPPFQEKDSHRLLYAHIARTPVHPANFNGNIPRVLGNIVLKLLEKNAEDRYQTAAGILRDLRECEEGGEGVQEKVFRVGEADVFPGFAVAHKLYGRDVERGVLLQKWDEVAAGAMAVLLVSGYSGVGKTSLVREVYRPLTRDRGFFAAGKFDQYRSHRPYSAFLVAFEQLTRQILGQEGAVLQRWEKAFLVALREKVSVVTSLIPDFAELVGPQQEPAELPPSERQNRLFQALKIFLSVFSSLRHPVVLFLDDLQWADPASLTLLSELSCGQGGYLLIVGAYRDNEVSPLHPLALAVARWKAEQAPLEELALQPLGENAVAQLLSDATAKPVEEALLLASLVVAKTLGNPFFVGQFLKKIHQDGLLRFSGARGGWSWDTVEISKQKHSENVVDLMAANIRKLPAETQYLLQVAACIGNPFDLDILASCSGVGRKEIAARLLCAAREEIVLPADGDAVFSADALGPHTMMRFFHDRIQQAAYSLVAEEERPKLHAEIGRAILAAHPGDLGGEVFALVSHWSIAGEQICEEKDLRKLVACALQASRKAKEAAAYDAALGYLRPVMARLGDGVWEMGDDLAMQLAIERSEAAYLCSFFEEAEKYAFEAIGRAKTPFEKADLHRMLVVQYTLRARYPEAIAQARAGLELVGIRLPEEGYEGGRDAEIARVEELLGGRPFLCLGDLPPMTDGRVVVAMRLLAAMGPPCYRSHQRLWGVIVALEVRLCLEYGSTPVAAYTYPAWGGLLSFVKGEVPQADDLCKATLRLMERFGSPADTSVGYLMIGSSLRHWFRPLREASKDYEDAYQTGLRSGNLQYSVYAFGHDAYTRFYSGEPIPSLRRRVQETLSFSEKRKNQWGMDLKNGLLRVLLWLAEEDGGAGAFSFRQEAEEDYLLRCKENANTQVACIYRILKMQALYFLGHYREAYEESREAEKLLISVATQGLHPVLHYKLYRVLILCELLPELEDAGEALREAQEHTRFLGKLAAVCKESYEPLALLAEAQVALAQGEESDKVFCLFEKAAGVATFSDFPAIVALAAEKASLLCRKMRKDDEAVAWMFRSRAACERWGAVRKVRAIDAANAPVREESALPYGEEIEVALAEIRKVSGEGSLEKSLLVFVKNAGVFSAATSVCAVVKNGETGRLVISYDANTSFLRIARSAEAMGAEHFPETLVNYVLHTGKTVFEDTAEEFVADSFFRGKLPASLRVHPLVCRGKVVGALYLEHTSLSHLFDGEEKRKLLDLLISEAMKNASLFL